MTPFGMLDSVMLWLEDVSRPLRLLVTCFEGWIAIAVIAACSYALTLAMQGYSAGCL